MGHVLVGGRMNASFSVHSSWIADFHCPLFFQQWTWNMPFSSDPAVCVSLACRQVPVYTCWPNLNTWWRNNSSESRKALYFLFFFFFLIQWCSQRPMSTFSCVKWVELPFGTEISLFPRENSICKCSYFSFAFLNWKKSTLCLHYTILVDHLAVIRDMWLLLWQKDGLWEASCEGPPNSLLETPIWPILNPEIWSYELLVSKCHL